MVELADQLCAADAAALEDEVADRLAIAGLFLLLEAFGQCGHIASMTHDEAAQDLGGVAIAGTLTVVGVGAALVGWLAPDLSRGTGDRTLTTIFACSGLAEYVNDYHRQLQHFDHGPDFRRLLAGRGFRRSRLASDLRRWRDARA